jgi:hypothetical protein
MQGQWLDEIHPRGSAGSEGRTGVVLAFLATVLLKTEPPGPGDHPAAGK